MFKWAVKKGIAKNEKQAFTIFACIILLSIVGTIYITAFNPFNHKQSIPNGYKVINTPGQPPIIVPVQ